MREIKFRAWYNNKMWEVNSLEWIEHDNNPPGAYLFGLEGWVVVREEPMKSHSSLAELMQYTGLKDVNGVEIYEGDIVRFNGNGGPCKTIIFDGPDVLHGKTLLTLAWGFGNNPEVMGNKFENPELLKEEEGI